MKIQLARGILLVAATMLLAMGQAEAQTVPGRDDPGNRAEGTIPLRPTGVVAGEYIVVFDDGVDDPAGLARALARTHGLDLHLVYSVALKGFAASIPERALAALERNPRIAYIEPDQWVQTYAQTNPTGIGRIFATGNANLYIDGVDDERVDVDVAVIDTGVDSAHPDLNVVAGTNCAKGGPFAQSCAGTQPGDQIDGYGHGTHVAGTIGAIDNGFGVVGVAPGARIWAVRVLDNRGSGYMSWIVAGIDWVTARADVIDVANMSLGCACSSNALNDAITASVASGITYAVSAGNSDADAGAFSPANHPDVITVSALADFDGLPGGLGGPTCRPDEDDTLANFSNYGSTVEIAAPGVCILSTWKGGGYNTISGTSMASPHVAGAAALLAASGMTDPDTIRTALINNGNSNWTDDSGDGTKERLLDVSNAGVFAPATVAGEGGGGTPVTDDPPTASWLSPSGTVSGSAVLIRIDASDAEDLDGTLDVQWRVDGGAWQPALSSGGTFYDDTWDTTGVADGSHTLAAIATDSAFNDSTEVQVTVTVDNGGTGGEPVAVESAAVSYTTSGGRNRDKHLQVIVTVLDGGGLPVSGAVVAITVSTTADGYAPRSASGPTSGDGTATFSWSNAPAGCYETTALTVDGGTPPTLDYGDPFCK